MTGTTCDKCGKAFKPKKWPGGVSLPGYGTLKENGVEKKVCYKCMGAIEKREIGAKKPGDRWTLYLGKKDGKYSVSNWPGSLKYPVRSYSTGRHNMGGTRIDVWFQDHKGRWWHGFQVGDYTDLVHCRLLKRKPDWAR